MKFALLITCLALPAMAQACPAVPVRSAEKAELYAGLLTAKNEMGAAPYNAGLWEIWLDAPDEIAQAMLNEGMALRRVYDFLGSVAVLNDLVDYCPDYAEGYNQRAFAYFLARDFEASLADLDRTLVIDPRHIGALSGKGLTLIELGRNKEAQVVLKEAVALHPWLSERFLIEEPPGTDL